MGYKITNIEYGVTPLQTEYIYGMIGNPKPDELEDNVHSITLIQGEGRNILVDTGVDCEDAEVWEVAGPLFSCCKGTKWALEQVGLTPDDIDTVIITHLHVDHIGGLRLFPNAKIFLQKEEFESWEEVALKRKYQQITVSAAVPPGYPGLRKMVYEGNIRLLEGDVTEIAPGIDIHVKRDCHAFAEQVVCVKSDGVEYLIAGDLAFRVANIFGTDDWPGYLVPILGRSGSAVNVMDSYEWIEDRIDGDPSRLVLTHDTMMKDRFESEPTEDGLYLHYIVK